MHNTQKCIFVLSFDVFAFYLMILSCFLSMLSNMRATAGGFMDYTAYFRYAFRHKPLYAKIRTFQTYIFSPSLCAVQGTAVGYPVGS